MAAHRTTGTARRAFLGPRVVRAPPLVKNAGAARPPPRVEAHPADVSRTAANLRDASCG
jgi:hypothetical protein